MKVFFSAIVPCTTVDMLKVVIFFHAKYFQENRKLSVTAKSNLKEEERERSCMQNANKVSIAQQFQFFQMSF